MALFDKPFLHIPADDISGSGSGSDVAVADAVTEAILPAQASAEKPVVSEAIPPAPAAAEKLVATEPIQPARAAAEKPVVAEAIPVMPAAGTPAATEAGASREVPASVDIPVAPGIPAPPVTPAPIDAGHEIARAMPSAELVPHEEHGLRTGDTGALPVFTRVVPSEPCFSAPRDTQRLVNAIDEADPVLDQLRSLAATLHQARTGRELKVIAVTSSVSGEGKTLLAANLALTLSRSYMRQVLLIDADLRRPNLHRLFGIPSQEGIRTALDAVREGTPVAVQEVAPRLALLPAGKPVRDPISVLASDAMQRLMTAATATFDWVIVDTPPVGMLPDVSLLSTLSDAVLLVVEAGRVRYDLVQRTVESVGADRIFGVVLNKVPERDIVAAYGMHYYAPYR